MAECGMYKPLSLDDAVNRSAEIFEMLMDAGVQVIRIGLHASENLSSSDTYFAGPNHPALGELVENEYYYKKIYNYLSDKNISDASVNVTVARGCLSKAIGQNRRNKLRLGSAFPSCRFLFRESADVNGYGVKVEIEERKNKCT
jgi:histone acetyltransferase (RNA polymerase elongator complex component)